MKQVNELQEKHRRDIWGDDDGYIWFWDVDREKWACLSPCTGGSKVVYRVTPKECYAPYARIAKGFR